MWTRFESFGGAAAPSGLAPALASDSGRRQRHNAIWPCILSGLALRLSANTVHAPPLPAYVWLRVVLAHAYTCVYVSEGLELKGTVSGRVGASATLVMTDLYRWAQARPSWQDGGACCPHCFRGQWRKHRELSGRIWHDGRESQMRSAPWLRRSSCGMYVSTWSFAERLAISGLRGR